MPPPSAAPSNRTPIRVGIVNDVPLVAQGVAALLRGEAGIDVVEVATSGSIDQPIDVALYDTFGTHQLDGAELGNLLREPLIRALVAYTSRSIGRELDDLLRRGCRGMLPKSLDGPELAEAIRRVHAGEVVVLGEQGRAPTVGTWPGQDLGLTERESDTLALVAQGFENEEIAASLYVSVNTVKSRLRAIYQKLPVDNRVRAALWADAHGFTDGQLRPGPP